MTLNATASDLQTTVDIYTPKAVIEASLCVPDGACGLIVFAHSAHSSRDNPQDECIAEILRQNGFATLLMELLTTDEKRLDVLGKLSYDIPLLAGRIDCAAEWASRNKQTSDLPVGYFGSGTGAAAAFVASMQKKPDGLRAIVSRQGRADLAESILPDIKPPILFIIEPNDKLNENRRLARKALTEKKLVTVTVASCFFETCEHLEEIAELSASWFSQHISANRTGMHNRLYSHIDSCSFGRIRVDGKDYTDDLIVFPEKQVVSWWRRENHKVTFCDLKEIVNRKPELFIVGTGTIGNLQLVPSARQLLKKYKIAFREETTQTASVLFNKAIERGTKAAGAFHLTC